MIQKKLYIFLLFHGPSAQKNISLIVISQMLYGVVNKALFDEDR